MASRILTQHWVTNSSRNAAAQVFLETATEAHFEECWADDETVYDIKEEVWQLAILAARFDISRTALKC